MAQSDVLEIRCPKCNKVHLYELEVKRSMVLENLSMLSSNRSSRSTHISFTRLFTCPKKEEDFQATFSLVESSASPIRSVEVKGIIKDGNSSQ